MFCQNCGTKIEDGSQFCSNCGIRIFEHEVQKDGRDEEKDSSLGQVGKDGKDDRRNVTVEHIENDRSHREGGWIKFFFSFSGRRGRKEYIETFGITFAGLLVILITSELIIPLFLLIPLLWVMLANDVRRFHDLGKSTKFAIVVEIVDYVLSLFFIFPSIILLLCLMAIRGDKGTNQYGDDPTI